MSAKSTSLGYVVGLGMGLVGMGLSIGVTFFKLNESQVSKVVIPPRQTAILVTRPVVTPWVDTTTPWQPTPEAALLDTVYTLRTEGRRFAALAVLEGWLRENPDDLARRIDAARLAFEVGQEQSAVLHYREYLRRQPDRGLYREVFERVRTELVGEDMETALKTLLDVDTETHWARLSLAEQALRAGDAERTLDLLAVIPPHMSVAADSLRRSAWMSIPMSTNAAQRALADAPDEPAFLVALARALVADGDLPAALAPYRRALDRLPTVPLRREVIEVALEADSLEPANEWIRTNLAAESRGFRPLLQWVQTRLGEEAVVSIIAGMLEDAPDALIVRTVGIALEEMILTPAAGADARRLLVSRRPTDTRLRHRLALDLVGSGDRVAAEAALDTIISIDPRHAAALTLRAELRANRRDAVGALEDVRRAGELAPDPSLALLEGDLLLLMGGERERTQAIAAYERAALRLSPTDPRLESRWRQVEAIVREYLRWVPGFGLLTTSTGLTDSNGLSSMVLRTQNGIAPFRHSTTVLTVALEGRQLSESRLASATAAGALDVGLGRRWGAFSLQARGGLVASGSAANATMMLDASHERDGVRWRGLLARQAAYERLRSAGSFTRGRHLMESVASVSATEATVGPLVVGAEATAVALSDGNQIGIGILTTRLPLRSDLALVYTGSSSGFAQTTADYWSPERFTNHALGLELRSPGPGALSYAVRAAPAYATVRMRNVAPALALERAWLTSISGELNLRRAQWDLGLFVGYGQDRGGRYAATNAGLRLARIP